MPPAAQGADSAGLPRSARVIGIPLAAVVLIAFFLFLGFPWDVLGERIVSELERSQGVHITFGELGPTLQLAGPALEAADLHLQLPDGRSIQVDRALLRPAWSLAWFRGSPAIYTEIEGPFGAALGTVILGERSGWDGEFRQLDLAQLPLTGLLPQGALEGTLDATLDIIIGEKGPEGPVSFEVHDGSVSLPALPVALPFERLAGDLIFGGESYLVLEDLSLEGPIVSGNGGGTIGHAKSFQNAQLQLDFQLEVKPALAGPVRSAGLRVNRDGNTRVRVSGTVGNPRVR